MVTENTTTTTTTTEEKPMKRYPLPKRTVRTEQTGGTVAADGSKAQHTERQLRRY